MANKMQYVANLTRANIDVVDWAKRCEDTGWDGVAIADHTLLSERLWPHMWVLASAAAVATERVFITTAFANNLMRHPFEFAQASMAMQSISGGRFEAGLGAGWAAGEMAALGLDFPPPGERVGRFVEALDICRQLFDSGRCSFVGEWYEVDIEHFGIDGVEAPPLVGSLGGPRMLREASPYLDRIEIKGAAAATRGGELDFARIGSVTRDDVKRQVDLAHQSNPDAPLSFFALCSASATSDALVADFADSAFYKPFFGEVAQVIEAFESLAELGIDRATISPLDPAQFETIAEQRPA